MVNIWTAFERKFVTKSCHTGLEHNHFFDKKIEWARQTQTSIQSGMNIE